MRRHPTLPLCSVSIVYDGFVHNRRMTFARSLPWFVNPGSGAPTAGVRHRRRAPSDFSVLPCLPPAPLATCARLRGAVRALRDPTMRRSHNGTPAVPQKSASATARPMPEGPVACAGRALFCVAAGPHTRKLAGLLLSAHTSSSSSPMWPCEQRARQRHADGDDPGSARLVLASKSN